VSLSRKKRGELGLVRLRKEENNKDRREGEFEADTTISCLGTYVYSGDLGRGDLENLVMFLRRKTKLAKI
jgi:hypothetical protein